MPKLMLKKPATVASIITLIVAAILLVNTAPLGQAQTSTVITSDTTWSKADSPITLQGKVQVKDGATLTIEPGVTVNFGNYYLRVEGDATLNARGTSSNPIHFKGTGELSGIELVTSATWDEQTSSGTIIDNAIIDFAYLSCDNAKVSNSVITVRNFFMSGIYAEVSNNKITGNVHFDGGKISYNMINGDAEIGLSPNVSYNTIKGSVTISGDDSGKPVISHNFIEGSITQFHGSSTLSYNDISGKVALSGGPPTVTYNTLYNGLSLSQVNGTISNNNILGGEVGISVGTSFRHIYVIITNNIISDCTTAGIKASHETRDLGPIGTTNGDVTLLISGNMIKDCNYGIDLSDVKATIEGNLFMNNKYGLIGGSSIQHNTFSNNDVGVASLGTVRYNNFQNNRYGFSMQMRTMWIHHDINATYNWWGTTDKEAIKQTLYDYKNDFELGNITFEPYLTSPDPTAPTTSYQPITGPSTENIPTTTPSTQPTQASSQPTAETPTQPNTQEETVLGLEWRDLVIALLGVVVAVLAIAIVLLLRHRGKR
jgi:hypothetical protein